jgi:hypothetical protein
MESAGRKPRLHIPSQSPSLVLALLALVVSLGGTATAAGVLITSRDIKDGTIQLVDISPKAKGSLHTHAASAVALDDVVTRKRIRASSIPRAGDLLPLGKNGEFAETALPLDSTTKAPNIAARVYSSHDQLTPIQIAFGPVYRLTFDQVSFDTAHLFNPADPTRLKAPVAGIYLITTNVSWEVQFRPPPGYNRAVVIYVNGDHAIAVDQRPPAEETRHVVTTVYRLNAGDTVEVGIGQDSGDLVANAVGDYAPSLAMVWIAPG